MRIPKDIIISLVVVSLVLGPVTPTIYQFYGWFLVFPSFVFCFAYFPSSKLKCNFN